MDLVFAEGAAGIALIDVDHKGMRDDQRLRIREAGGVWKVLSAVVPALANTARVVRDFDIAWAAQPRDRRGLSRQRRIAHRRRRCRQRRHSAFFGRL